MRATIALAVWVLMAAGCKGDGPAELPDVDVAVDVAPDQADSGDAGDDTGEPAQCPDFDPLRRPFFGDTHVHTALSLDAVLQGTRLMPRDAYRFARGEEVGIQPYDADGKALRTLKLGRPLDFAALSDHAEFFGEVHLCQTPGSAVYDDTTCQLFREDPQSAFYFINAHLSFEPDDASHVDFCGDDGTLCVQAGKTFWEETQAAAAEFDDRCSFTSFVGYEWSGSPGTENMHRNVIFASDVVPELPVSYFDAPYPEQLWEQLRAGCLDAGTGCDVLAIPHNTNLSGGRMFESAAAWTDGSRTAEDARWRSQIEPLIEIFQHKGDSECMATAADELCGFEKMPFANLSGPRTGVEKDPTRLDFVRAILAEGLKIRATLGENPYLLGIIASTDTHLGTPGAVREEDHPGHGGAGPSASQAGKGLPDEIAFNPGGLAVLWAEENSRESLFAAMRRREAYGTSGPRIVLRFFGGWEYPDGLCDEADLVEVGYRDGVPMGGQLGAQPAAGGAPTFVLSALKDAGIGGAAGTDLQRIQIIKGSLDRSGEPVTTVFEVGGDPDNGASVDVASCQPQGEGFDTLCDVWSDPDFDPTVPAFYYARVVENPTCRWSTWACNAANVDCAGDVPTGWAGCCDERYPKTVQERAWSSPIWYVPG